MDSVYKRRHRKQEKFKTSDLRLTPNTLIIAHRSTAHLTRSGMGKIRKKKFTRHFHCILDIVAAAESAMVAVAVAPAIATDRFVHPNRLHANK